MGRIRLPNFDRGSIREDAGLCRVFRGPTHLGLFHTQFSVRHSTSDHHPPMVDSAAVLSGWVVSVLPLDVANVEFRVKVKLLNGGGVR